MDFVNTLFSDYTLRTVTLGTVLLGVVSGALGTFAVLRRQSLLGDAISHAALPGIGLAFLLLGSKEPLVLMVGAAIAGWLATALILVVTSSTRIKYDSALGIALSVFFGLGLVILTFIQKTPNAAQAGLDSFLFGQASSLIVRDVKTMAVLGGITLMVLAAGWKEFKLLAFDSEFAGSLHLPIRRLDLGLTTLLVIAIVIGLQTVGVVLMSAMIVAPAAAARQWTDRLGRMTFLAMFFGAFSGVVGAMVSAGSSNLPTGPTIVTCISIIVVLSMLFAPRRGLLWHRLRRWQSSRRLVQELVLLDLYALASQHEDPAYPHTEAALQVMRPGVRSVNKKLRDLAVRGWVRDEGDNAWSLTIEGLLECRRLLAERTV